MSLVNLVIPFKKSKIPFKNIKIRLRQRFDPLKSPTPIRVTLPALDRRWNSFVMRAGRRTRVPQPASGRRELLFVGAARLSRVPSTRVEDVDASSWRMHVNDYGVTCPRLILDNICFQPKHYHLICSVAYSAPIKF